MARVIHFGYDYGSGGFVCYGIFEPIDGNVNAEFIGWYIGELDGIEEFYSVERDPLAIIFPGC